MMVSTVDAVVQLPSDPRLHGASVDEPTVGQRVETGAINVWGWVLGRSAPVHIVEVLSHLGPTRATLAIDRPHVANAFPRVPNAARSGFAAVVDLRSARRMDRFLVEARLADGSRLALCAVHVHHGWCSLDPKVADLVSVVIRDTGDQDAVRTMAASVSAQTYPQIEQVVLPAARTRRRKRGLVARQRNAGIRCSNGDFLLFVDAGGMLEPELVATAVHALQSDPALAAIRVQETGARGGDGPILYRRAALHSVGYFEERAASPDVELMTRLERHAMVGCCDLGMIPG